VKSGEVDASVAKTENNFQQKVKRTWKYPNDMTTLQMQLNSRSAIDDALHTEKTFKQNSMNMTAKNSFYRQRNTIDIDSTSPRNNHDLDISIESNEKKMRADPAQGLFVNENFKPPMMGLHTQQHTYDDRGRVKRDKRPKRLSPLVKVSNERLAEATATMQWFKSPSINDSNNHFEFVSNDLHPFGYFRAKRYTNLNDQFRYSKDIMLPQGERGASEVAQLESKRYQSPALRDTSWNFWKPLNEPSQPLLPATSVEQEATQGS
jgi:hypothetical protein